MRVVLVYVNMEDQPQMVALTVILGGRRWRLKSITPWVTSDRDGDELKRYPAVGAEAPVPIPCRASNASSRLWPSVTSPMAVCCSTT